MSIQGFFRKTVATQRLTNVGGGSHRQDWQEVIAELACAIHPVSPEDTVALGSAFYQTFKLFCSKTADIEVNDRIVDGDDIYTVKGKSPYDDMGGKSNEHARYVIVKGK